MKSSPTPLTLTAALYLSCAPYLLTNGPLTVGEAAAQTQTRTQIQTLITETLHSDPDYQEALNLRRVPIPELTPGVARDDLTVEEMCAKKWGKDKRDVTEAMKLDVYKGYGVDVPKINGKYVFPHYAIWEVKNGKRTLSIRPLYEVDHKYSREVLGADDPRNLSLQSYVGDCNAHDKDRLENRLHVEACSSIGSNLNKLTLKEVYEALDDWIPAYNQRFGSCKHPDQY